MKFTFWGLMLLMIDFQISKEGQRRGAEPTPRVGVPETYSLSGAARIHYLAWVEPMRNKLP